MGRSILVALSLCIGVPVYAADSQLQAGNWVIEEGVGIGSSDRSTQSRNVCIEDGAREVSPEWFASLAAPRSDCRNQVVSQSQNSIVISHSCGATGAQQMNGQSMVTLGEGQFSIRGEVSMDLGGVPFGLEKRVRGYQSGICR